MEKKAGKLKQIINKLLGTDKAWKLGSDGHLDVEAGELARIREEYGDDFISKFEKLLSEENENTNNQIQTEMPKILTLALVCAVLGVKELQAAEDGSVTLNQDQLDTLEAELKRLQDEKTAAESGLAETTRLKEAADKALSDAVTAMDDLDATVKEAATPADKVEAIRVKLAAKPAVDPAQNLGEDGKTDSKIDGKDEVNEYIRHNFPN